jgi:MoaE-MoaD fusion protein
MRLQAKLFAVARDRAGTDQITLELQPGATVDDAIRALHARFPPLAELREKLMYAVNDGYAGTDRVLLEGDELAVIPPVSGG